MWRLKDVTGLETLSSVGHGTAAMGEQLFIGFNPVLTSLQGLSGLVSVGADLVVTDNPQLPNLTGLEKVRHVSGWLSLERNQRLRSLAGLEQLENAFIVFIGECPTLTSLHALAGMSYVEDGLTIHDNAKLPTCEAKWFRDHVMLRAGDVDISNNNDAGTCP